MGLFSQNRLNSINEDAEILDFYNHISYNENTPSILEVCMLASNMRFLESVEDTINESVLLESFILNEESKEMLIAKRNMAQKNLDKATNDKDEAGIQKFQKQVDDLNKQIDAADQQQKDNTAQDANAQATTDNKDAENKEANKKANQGKGEEILAKLQNLFHRFAEAISALAGRVLSKLRSVVNNDEKIIAKYSQYTDNWDKYKDGFEGVDVNPQIASEILGKEAAKIADTANPEDIKIISQYHEIAKKYIPQIKNAADEQAVATIVSNCKSEMNKYSTQENQMKDQVNKMDKPSEDKNAAKFIPDATNLANAKRALSEGIEPSLKFIEDAKKAALKVFKDEEIAAKTDLKDAKVQDATSLETAKTRAIFELHKLVSQKSGKQFSIMVTGAIRSYKIARKVFIVCGKYAMEKAGKSKNNETEATGESYEWLDNYTAYVFGESSDEFIDSVFAEL